MTVQEIHQALRAGKNVKWANEDYEVFYEPIREAIADHDKNHHTQVDGYLLTCRHRQTFHGGFLAKSEVSSCFISDSKKQFKNKDSR